MEITAVLVGASKVWVAMGDDRWGVCWGGWGVPWEADGWFVVRVNEEEVVQDCCDVGFFVHVAGVEAELTQVCDVGEYVAWGWFWVWLDTESGAEGSPCDLLVIESDFNLSALPCESGGYGRFYSFA